MVEAGSVTFERNPRCDDAILSRYFTEWVLAALLRHRGLLVLHASALETGGGVLVLGGDSGAGKSTTLTALLDRGCRMLSDDVTAVRFGLAPGSLEVVPGAAQTHLTRQAAENLGYCIESAQLQPWRRMKAAICTREGMALGPGRLRALYVLKPSCGNAVSVTETTGGDKVQALHGCLYGPMFTEDHPALFPLLSTVLTTIPFLRLERPPSMWSVGAVADAILAHAPQLAS